MRNTGARPKHKSKSDLARKRERAVIALYEYLAECDRTGTDRNLLGDVLAVAFALCRLAADEGIKLGLAKHLLLGSADGKTESQSPDI